MLKSKGRNWLLAIASIFIASTAFAQNLRISGGNGHSVVICANGTVFAWGKNDVGQLGLQTDNVTPYGGAFSSTPRQVGGLGQIFQIDAGSGSHTLALTCQGKVYAWGANATNQLGNNTAAPGAFSATPVLVKAGVTGAGDLSGVKYVSGGNDESFALLNSKRIVSWGQNDKGQLGDGTTIDRATPVYVINGLTGLPLENVKQIEAGDENGYALTEDGTVWSWGEPTDSKALGRTTTGTDNRFARPVQIAGGGILTGIKEISAGDRHGLAITDGGQVYSWGGDWGQGQLGQGPNYQSFDYAALVVGGASGEAFLGDSDPVVSIAAGQAHSLVSTASGKVYTWGSNGFFLAPTPTPAGQLGVGTAGGIATNPVYFASATGPNQSPMLALNGASGFTNAISVSDGDAWSFVLTGDGKIYVAGYNVEGQLGIAGNTTNQYTFTELAIPSCGVITPCPTLDLGLDLTYCLPFTVTLDAGLVYPGFTVNLYKNDVLQPGSVVRPWVLGGGPINVSFPVSTYANEWKIEIVDMRTATQRPCSPCPTAKDSIAILPYASNFGDPGNLEFCGLTSTVHVTETGSSATTVGSTYEWYAAQTGGTALATTTDIGTATLNVSTLVKTGTAPNRIASVWVEDKSTFTTTLATTAQVGASSLDPNQKSGAESRMTFSVAKALKVNTIRVNLRSYDAAALNWSFGIYNAAGVLQGTNVPFTSGVATGNTWATLDFGGLALAPGNYYIQYINGNSGVSFYTNPGNAYSGVYQYNGQTILDFISTNNPGVTTYFPAYVDWNVTVGSPYPCGRLEVLITENCPPCNKPTSVTVNGGTSPINKCVGDPAFTVSGAYVNAGNPVANTAMTYVWYKQGSTPGTPIALTAPTPVTTTASQTVPARNFTSPVALDAGTWILRVEDGNTGSATCYTEGTVVLNVNPLPTITSAATGTVCSGIAQNYAITSSIPSSYAWTRAAVTGISNAAGTGSTSPITETLTNTTTAAVVVRYIITPTSTTGSCVGPAFNYDVTVNPTPAITSAATGTICSGIAQNYAITSNVPSGYAWTRAAVTGISNAAGTGSTSPITETLTNTTTAAVVVRYIITPTSTTGSCVGPAFNYDVTVNPKPAITSAATGTICSGIAQNYAITSNVPSGYAWTRAAVTGISNAAGTGSTSPITETLTNTTTAAVVVRYIITPTSTTGSCVGTPFNYDVTVNPTPAITSAATGTVCSGIAQNYAITSNVPSGYAWTRAAVTGISNAAGTGSTSPITETLTNTTTAAVVVRYIITPTSITGSCVGTPFNYDVTVNPAPVPAVTIATPSTTICTGTSVTFTATPTNGGTTPTYQWYKGPVGSGTSLGATATNATYTTTTAANNDSYYVVMTSTAACANPTTATSNAIVMTVTTIVTPAVSITAAPAGPICAGTSVTFTASPGNGGNAPTYEWFIGSTSQGAASTTATTFTSTSLANGDQVSVIMTSNSTCVVAPGTATSNVITMVVNPVVTPSVSIAVSPGGAICPGTSITFTATPTNGGTPTYQWFKGPVGSGTSLGATATNATYTTTTAANNDSYYVVMTSNAVCATPATATSNAIVITVTPVPAISVSIVSDRTTICSGQPVLFTATASGSGSTPAPTYEWFVTSAATATGGTSQGAPSTTATTFTTSALTAANNKVYVQVVSNAACAATTAVASNVVAITVNAGIGAGTIGSDQTICYNGTPAALTQVTAASGVTAAAAYTWEASLDGSTGWAAIPGSGTGYTFPAVPLTQDVYIRRIVTDATLPAPCNTATSNAVHITVRPQLVAGVIGTDETICSGSVPAVMTQTTAPAGGTGTYTYQWESDATGTFAPISGATNSSYTSAALTATTQFRRVETSGTCGSVTSNVVTKTISAPEVVTVSINDPGQVCDGSAAFTFTATAATTGTGTLSYAWTLGGLPTGTNSSSYTYTPVIGDDNKVVQVVVTTSNGCNSGPATSNAVTLDIVGATVPTVTITTLNNPNCAGLMSTFTATSTGGGMSPTYQWYVDPAGAAGPVAVGTGGTTYSTSTLADGDQVYVELTSSLGCLIGTNPFTSNKITMVIKPIPAPAITEGDQTICSPNSFTFHGIVTAGNSYEWRETTGNTVVGTGVDFTATQSGTYALYEDNGTCNSTSQPVTLTIIQTPIAHAGADIYLKQGDIGTLNGSGGAVYSWSPSTYLTNPAISNPGFTATQTITYTLTVSDPTNTCSTIDDVTVYVVKPIIVPNVITVNGDGVNDDWYLENIEGYPNCIIEIYNRWGNLVWKSEGYPKNWDGTNFRNGEILPDGTYFYIINLKSQIYDEPLTGWVQVMK